MPAPVAAELFDTLLRLMPLIAAPFNTDNKTTQARVEFGGADDDSHFILSTDYQFDNYNADEGVRMLSGYTDRFCVEGSIKYRQDGTRYGRVELFTYTVRVGNRRRPAFSKAQERLLRQHGFVLTAGSCAEWVV